MRVSVVAIGRVKHAALRETCDEYERRVRRYFTFDVRIVRDATGGARPAAAVCRSEGDALLKAVPAGARVFLLSRDGQLESSSQSFARRIADWLNAARDVTLLIGGAHGVDHRVRERAEAAISLSPLTLSHDLARLVLFEQLYRAGTILRGEPYHKGAE